MRLRILLVLLVVAAPTAQARSAVQGDVRFDAPPVMEGDAAWRAPAGGALDLAPALGERPVISWAAASGSLVTTTWYVVTDPTGEPYTFDPSRPAEKPLSWSGGALRNVTCEGDCDVLLVATQGGAVGLRGGAHGWVATLDAPLVRWGEWSDGGPGSFHVEFPAGTPVVSGRSTAAAPATLLSGAEPLVEGRVQLFLRNVTAEVATASGVERIDTRTTIAPVAHVPLPGAPEASRVESRYALFDLDGAAVRALPGTPARLFAPGATVALDGTLRSAETTGSVAYGGRSYDLRGEPLVVEGGLRLALAPPAPALNVAGHRAGSTAPVSAALGGDADRVRVNGARATGSDMDEATATAVRATGIAAVVAALLWLCKGALAPFYSRISKSRVFANSNRAEVYRHVVSAPGLTAADLRRRTGLSRFVVDHHLRTLERHGLVARRQDGQRQRVLSLEGTPRETLARVPASEDGASRRKVLDVLSSAPQGLTQKEIVALTGFSQRLVSYHLRRLEATGNVVASGPLPRRYSRGAATTAPAAGS